MLATVGQAAPYTSNLHGGGGGRSSGSGAGRAGSGSGIVNNNNNNRKLSSAVVETSNTTNSNGKQTSIGHQLHHKSQYQSRSLLATATANHHRQQQQHQQQQQQHKQQLSNSSNNCRPTTVTAANAASSFMKTISVRLHRGTEYIKDTVQRALVVSSAAAPAASCSTSTLPSSTVKSHTAAATSTTTGLSIGGLGVQRTTQATTSSATTSTIQRSHVTPSASFLKLYTVPPTALHRSAEARQNASSTDSLLKEMCHFKPIRPVPQTPIKIGQKPHGCDIKIPKLIFAASLIDLDIDCDATTSTVLKPTTITTIFSTAHKSAFVKKLDINIKSDKSHGTDITKPKNKRRRRKKITFGRTRRKVQKHCETKQTKPNITPHMDIADIESNDEDAVAASASAATTAKKTSSRKRKHVASDLEEEESSLKFQCTDSGKGKRKERSTEGRQTSATAKLKSNQRGGGSKQVAAAATATTKKATSGTANTLLDNIRRSPPMTRQRARQISYNQSK